MRWTLKPDVLKGWIPGGWQFYQAETNWGAPDPMTHTFQEQVANIIKHRKQNAQFHLSTDYLTVARELIDRSVERIGAHRKYCMQIGDDAQKKTSSSPSAKPTPAVAAAVAAPAPIDTSVLREWLGEGGVPVALGLAEGRAGVCAICPENSAAPNCHPDRRMSWREWLNPFIAAKLRRYLSAKHQMKLATSRDAELGKCLACRCELPLKVFVPTMYIKANTHPEDLAKLDPGCWVLKELNASGVLS